MMSHHHPEAKEEKAQEAQGEHSAPMWQCPVPAIEVFGHLFSTVYHVWGWKGLHPYDTRTHTRTHIHTHTCKHTTHTLTHNHTHTTTHVLQVGQELTKYGKVLDVLIFEVTTAGYQEVRRRGGGGRRWMPEPGGSRSWRTGVGRVLRPNCSK